ncbi:hypothetical protein [Duganella hordei]|uniref:hypothetical protein n=1 Tax=Duganella hordei TaxID=2865934 RepID=UPI0030E7C538
MRTSNFAALLVMPLFCGCDRAPAANNVQTKSATYYAQHLDEAARVAAHCDQLNAQKQHALSVGDYQEWQISKEWVNCETAMSVTEAAAIRESVKQQNSAP